MVYRQNIMIEIIVLIFLTREIGNLATRKGLKSGLWKFYMVAGWIFMELVGAVVHHGALGQVPGGHREQAELLTSQALGAGEQHALFPVVL